ncbi:hypothetical protein [Streptococcus gordonii]|uniref:hypothetical protein n=1 Tax=Streptococcus gordonii TaxID=1302 RepID=UPI000779324B|nr:hypothetical protein [Streptococcus gordonii]MBZ2139755.1 hypothetical protein [Streptococcus gordonii]QBX16365.1 hypothetical protein Javan247_0046 [Streptococcus phage Javan247]HEP5937598.1 hypothetical protein [Streptococcus pyogenes]
MKKVKVFIVGFLALAALGFVLQALGLAPKTKAPEAPKVATQSSSAEAKEKAPEKTETAESSSESDDKLPRVSADQMASFIEYFKQDLTDKGVDITTYTFHSKDTILYVNVPNEYKYYSKTDLQAFADGLKAKEHEAFNVWAGINGVDFKSYPMLHIKTDDGNSLVSQKMNGEMKVKVK